VTFEVLNHEVHLGLELFEIGIVDQQQVLHENVHLVVFKQTLVDNVLKARRGRRENEENKGKSVKKRKKAGKWVEFARGEKKGKRQKAGEQEGENERTTHLILLFLRLLFEERIENLFF
jgi:hypothetical protein